MFIPKEKYDAIVKERDLAIEAQKAAERNLATALEKTTEMETALAEANTAIETMRADNTTAISAKDAEITTLKAKVAELGKAAGAPPASAKSETELSEGEGSLNVEAYADENLSMAEKLEMLHRDFK